MAEFPLDLWDTFCSLSFFDDSRQSNNYPILPASLPSDKTIIRLACIRIPYLSVPLTHMPRTRT